MLGVSITSIDISGSWSEHILDFFLRLICAATAGFIIGFERKSRSKEAGVRTHTLVAVGAALMMIISKYAFGDLSTGGVFADGVRGADSARIAAQVVSGVGFLGAGIIMYRRDSLRGLTTAAGIWATAGLGMAFGSGMYVVGTIATAVILGVQVILHLPIKAFQTRMFLVIHATIRIEDENTLKTVREIFHVQKFLKFRTMRDGEGRVVAELEIHTGTSYTDEMLYSLMQEYPFLLSVEQSDEL